MRLRSTWLAILIASPSAFSQNETALRQFFEGSTIGVKIDMPATSDGVDVHPSASMPVDFRKLADRIKETGVGVHQGESVMITKVILKKDHIEVQLGGGGFGTFSDRMTVASNTPVTVYEGRSRREKDLEEKLKTVYDERRRREIRAELDDLRRERMRANNLNNALNAQATQAQQANTREMRMHSGSRFNIWYKDGFPQDAMAPEGVMSALAKYAEFRQMSATAPARTSAASQDPESGGQPAARTKASEGGLKALKKGMTVDQVEQILGPAKTASQQKQGALEISVREYATDGLRVSTQFAGGVLIDFTITPG